MHRVGARLPRRLTVQSLATRAGGLVHAAPRFFLPVVLEPVLDNQRGPPCPTIQVPLIHGAAGRPPNLPQRVPRIIIPPMFGIGPAGMDYQHRREVPRLGQSTVERSSLSALTIPRRSHEHLVVVGASLQGLVRSSQPHRRDHQPRRPHAECLRRVIRKRRRSHRSQGANTLRRVPK